MVQLYLILKCKCRQVIKRLIKLEMKTGRFYSVYVTNETVEAVQRALYGEDYSMGALFFASNYSVNAGAWHVSALTRLFEYGGHVYFTF